MQTIDQGTTTTSLTPGEQQALDDCERVITTGLAAFYDAGRALRTIRDGKLYRAQFASFEEYCRERWSFTNAHAYRLIKAANVVKSLASTDQLVSLPASESVARPLTMIDPRFMKEVWTRANELSTRPTAKDVKKAIAIAGQENPGIRPRAPRGTSPKKREKKHGRKRIGIVKGTADRRSELDGVGRYSVILADVPWRYRSESSSLASGLHYPTMTTDEICALPVASVSADDAVLFLWAPALKLREAFTVLDAWGFTYDSGAVWDTETPKMGRYFELQHEHLLVATRGKLPAPEIPELPSSLIREKQPTRSAKPTAAYAMIESLYPTLPKLELFACGVPRDGWTAWRSAVMNVAKPAA